MKFMVFGGNGFVGRKLSQLLCEGHEVCVFDKLRYGGLGSMAHAHPRLDFVFGDINEADQVNAAVDAFAPDAIIQLAAIHYIPECEQDPALAVQTNVLGTVNTLMACPPGCRFVLASSGAVYRPDTQPHIEDVAAIEPSDIYGFSKLHCEHYTRYIAKERGFPAVVVRLFNVIGPGETNPHLMPEIVAQLKAGRTAIHLGNLQPKRDYIDVRDAAAGFRAAALNGVVENGEVVTVNLGTSHTYSVLEIVSKLREASGIDFEIHQDPARLRAVDRPILTANIEQIRRRFGWEPAVSIDEAIAELWRNPDLSEHLVAKYPIERAAPEPAFLVGAEHFSESRASVA